MFAKFLIAHWGKILSVILLTVFLGGIWFLYQENKDLIRDIVVAEDTIARQENTIDRLRREATETLEKLQALERKQEEHREDVQESREEVARIAAERDALLQELEDMEIPEDDEGHIRWMVEQAREIERRRKE